METFAKYGWILGLLCLAMATWNVSHGFQAEGGMDTFRIVVTAFMFIAGIGNLSVYFFVWWKNI